LVTILKGGRRVLNYHKGSYITALIKLYPELKLKKKFFSHARWRAPQLQRKFFDEFAKSNGFDPLDENQWYSVTSKQINRAGGGSAILKYYKGSHIAALIKLYPEVIFQKERFFEVWKIPHERRKFFDEFATSKQFDPLDSGKWYSVTRRDILKAGGRGVLPYYEDSHITALAEVYPELKLKRDCFFGSKSKHKDFQVVFFLLRGRLIFLEIQEVYHMAKFPSLCLEFS